VVGAGAPGPGAPPAGRRRLGGRAGPRWLERAALSNGLLIGMHSMSAAASGLRTAAARAPAVRACSVRRRP